MKAANFLFLFLVRCALVKLRSGTPVAGSLRGSWDFGRSLVNHLRSCLDMRMCSEIQLWHLRLKKSPDLWFKITAVFFSQQTCVLCFQFSITYTMSSKLHVSKGFKWAPPAEPVCVSNSYWSRSGAEQWHQEKSSSSSHDVLLHRPAPACILSSL